MISVVSYIYLLYFLGVVVSIIYELLMAYYYGAKSIPNPTSDRILKYDDYICAADGLLGRSLAWVVYLPRSIMAMILMKLTKRMFDK